jgi:hypothetical protein
MVVERDMAKDNRKDKDKCMDKCRAVEDNTISIDRLNKVK